MANVTHLYNNKPVWVEFKNFFIFGGIIAILAIAGLVFYFTQNNVEEVTANNIVRDFNYKIGKEDSNLQYIYFTDYQCPVCANNNPSQTEIEEEYQDRVLFVHKHNPLDDIHPQARGAARAVQAATEQDKFKEMSNNVYAGQDSLGSDSLRSYAESVGLDIDEWNNRRNSNEIRDQVQRDVDDLAGASLPESSIDGRTKAVGVGSGTPTVILIKDGEFIDWWSGALSREQVSQILDSNLN